MTRFKNRLLSYLALLIRWLLVVIVVVGLVALLLAGLTIAVPLIMVVALVMTLSRLGARLDPDWRRPF
jgi:hypothetical protein